MPTLYILCGLYNRVTDIDFAQLPESFVLKATHGSAWNIVCNDRRSLDDDEAKQKLNYWMGLNYSDDFGKERQYRKVLPRIVCEENISQAGYLPNDYKIMCFDGQPDFLQVTIGENGTKDEVYYDLNWNELPFTWSFSEGYKPGAFRPAKPDNFDQMLEIAAKLSSPFAHTRVDLYSVRKAIYFGELTFTPGNGLARFDPESVDFALGEKLKIRD